MKPFGRPDPTTCATLLEQLTKTLQMELDKERDLQTQLQQMRRAQQRKKELELERDVARPVSASERKFLLDAKQFWPVKTDCEISAFKILGRSYRCTPPSYQLAGDALRLFQAEEVLQGRYGGEFQVNGELKGGAERKPKAHSASWAPPRGCA